MKNVFLCAAFMMCFMLPLMAGAEKTVHQEGEGIAVPDVKKQFFCGYCHVLSYPNVIKKAYLSWRDGKHKDIGCVQCHYAPEQLREKIPGHKKIPKDEKAASEQSAMEYMKTELEVLSRLITIQNMDSSVVRTKPVLDDRSCTTSQCHPKTGQGKEGEYWTKKIQIAEYVRLDTSKGTVAFNHEKHFDSKKWVEGHEMHCTTCHARETEGKHFEVSRQKCFLCHFKNLALNQERAKCSLCHTVPEKPLQTQKTEDKPDEKPVTHKSLEEAKVQCESCHRQLVQGMGLVKAERCTVCHDKSEDLEKGATNRKLMHEKHVAEQAAHCFNCHESIAHKEDDFIDVARNECSACHPNHHKYQKLLLAGKEFKDVPETPGLMFRVKTNCLACHQGNKTVRGEPVAQGSGKACASCHTEKHEGMAKEWKDKADEELKAAREIEKEALDAIENAKGKVTDDLLKEASDSVKKGQEYMNFVEYGGGVHNKKYSIMLLDKAMNRFEDAIDLLSKEK